MMAVRGQTPSDAYPSLGEPTTEPFAPTYQGAPGTVPSDGFLPPLQPSTPTYDPFLGQQQYAPAPYSPTPFGLEPLYDNSYGAQPYQMGWSSRYDFGYLPDADVSPGTGDLGIFEFDAEWRYTTSSPGAFIFSHAPQFGLRTWDGPQNPGAVPGFGLPPDVYRFGWDFELTTGAEQPVSWLFGFNPSINSDLNQGLSSEAWQFDGRIALFYRQNPALTWVIGAFLWDRVDTIVLPYAGIVWIPEPRWELRLLFPEARASYYLGRSFISQDRTWLYATAEYHVEAYEIGLEPAGTTDQIQISDWRALLGLRFDSGRYQKFVEAGWVFEREVEYAGSTPGFDINSGFITRAGFRY
jgi:hypothetical protein